MVKSCCNRGDIRQHRQIGLLEAGFGRVLIIEQVIGPPQMHHLRSRFVGRGCAGEHPIGRILGNRRQRRAGVNQSLDQQESCVAQLFIGIRLAQTRVNSVPRLRHLRG